MSIKVPYGSTEYQSHNHCQCDFCNSRRNVNAKKWGVSQRAAQMQHSEKRNGCCCNCHNSSDAATFAAAHNATSFDPSYPAPVNQTALNASRGRNGIPQGDQWTIRNATTRGAADASGLNNSGTGKSKDEAAKDSMDDLDHLERLLIMEHKARVKASMDADALATLRATGSQNRPQVMPDDYAATYGATGSYGGQGVRAVTFNGNSGNGGSMMNYDNVDPVTVREAYELAHDCPVTPPPHCRASHRLQGTMTNLRMVTMDPINPDNRATLDRLVDEGGKAGTRKQTGRVATPPQLMANKDASGSKNKFGNSLAQVVTSNPHPVGAGMVWREAGKNPNEMTATSVAN